jgi:hypothetical protein
LSSFLDGWKALGEKYQLAWINEPMWKDEPNPWGDFSALQCLRESTWISWPDVRLSQTQVRYSKQVGLKKYVAQQMDDEGALFGLPAVPRFYRRSSDDYAGSRYSEEDQTIKLKIASKVVDIFIEKLKQKAESFLEEEIRWGGIEALKDIFEGNKDIEIVSKSKDGHIRRHIKG